MVFLERLVCLRALHIYGFYLPYYPSSIQHVCLIKHVHHVCYNPWIMRWLTLNIWRPEEYGCNFVNGKAKLIFIVENVYEWISSIFCLGLHSSKRLYWLGWWHCAEPIYLMPYGVTMLWYVKTGSLMGVWHADVCRSSDRYPHIWYIIF